MSIQFSQFTNNAVTRNNADDTIARGLNAPNWPPGAAGGKQATTINDPLFFVYDLMAIPLALDQQVTRILAKCKTANETERRLIIDAFFENIAVMANLNPVPKISLEPHIGSMPPIGGNGGAGFGLGDQIGHGNVDYTYCDQLGGGLWWRHCVTVEAKAFLGAGGDVGQWQLAATMATTNQIGLAGLTRYRRGILTDGAYWRFYQLDCHLGQLQRSPMLNVGIPMNQPVVVSMIHKFFRYYDIQTNIWTA